VNPAALTSAIAHSLVAASWLSFNRVLWLRRVLAEMPDFAAKKSVANLSKSFLVLAVNLFNVAPVGSVLALDRFAVVIALAISC